MCRVRIDRNVLRPGRSRALKPRVLKLRVLNPKHVPNLNLVLRPSPEDLSTDPINHPPKVIIPVSG
jgi:hypothetical protein